MTRRTRAGAHVLLLLAVGALLACRGAPDAPLPFRAERWRSGDDRIRARMAAGPSCQRELQGKSSCELASLLGKPDEVRNGAFVYGLGGAVQAEPLSLVISFRNGRVVTAALRTGCEPP